MKKFKISQLILNLILILLSITFVIPLIYTVSISVSTESDIVMNGYRLIPQHFSLYAWSMLMKNSSQLIQSYKVTGFCSIAATLASIVLMSMFAYPLVRQNCVFRKFLTTFMLITMLFNGGMVPTYILYTKYLHIDNTPWVYLLPGLISCYHVIVIRANFKHIPDTLIEAAKLDGASEKFILFNIMMPLNVPTLAAVAFLILIPRWNDWNTSLLYIQKPELYSLQYMLQRILRESEYLKQMALSGAETVDLNSIPSESYKYAIALAASGPMLIIFPFFEKYFVKGMTIGAVKG